MSVLTSVLPFAGVLEKVLDNLFPDPAAKAQAQMEVLRMEQAGQFRQWDSVDASDRNQAEINKVDAQSDRFFQWGWRAAAGWVAVLAMAYNYIMVPLLAYVMVNAYSWTPPGHLDATELMGLLFALLGLGGYRSFEIIKGRKIPS